MHYLMCHLMCVAFFLQLQICSAQHLMCLFKHKHGSLCLESWLSEVRAEGRGKVHRRSFFSNLSKYLNIIMVLIVNWITHQMTATCTCHINMHDLICHLSNVSHINNIHTLNPKYAVPLYLHRIGIGAATYAYAYAYACLACLHDTYMVRAMVVMYNMYAPSPATWRIYASTTRYYKLTT